MFENSNGNVKEALPKEMRLRNIASRDMGNAFLPEFIQDFNQRFGEEPHSTVDAHRPLTPKDDLAHILRQTGDIPTFG